MFSIENVSELQNECTGINLPFKIWFHIQEKVKSVDLEGKFWSQMLIFQNGFIHTKVISS